MDEGVRKSPSDEASDRFGLVGLHISTDEDSDSEWKKSVASYF